MTPLTALPVDRVVRVRGADPDRIALLAAHGGPDAPAVLSHRFRTANRVAGFVGAVLDDLETAAIGLYPAWLPAAEHIDSPGGAGLAAVRALAAERAAGTPHFGPFLADLAAGALSGVPARRRFAPEIRARGLARAVADGLGRARLVLLMRVPDGLGAEAERTVVAGAEWLADRAGTGVWLCGAPLTTIDRLSAVDLPARAPTPRKPAGTVAAVEGRPHPRSWCEGALEAALARQPWATGRAWNQTYRSHALDSPVRLDLLWRNERCVVEIDGPEHCRPGRFEEDRQRDVRLQLDGFAVLRFTNARVRHDVEAVVRQIGTLIHQRRHEHPRGQ
ncbi:hypothetical protein J2S43_000632 [Catenuloplanes nepalensis]|uniref:DUF559 domain-containing protein n=1 Tax=Catenuloplanes nepalensis TaxID=587533 RepID=A0ABT9ML21_9ACTN|nr:DUF559 domain-containing protein [Catenuloplanes nepalensis]MDP9792120.1 hypothetical protein [Catenuloplanes nepalensis]